MKIIFLLAFCVSGLFAMADEDTKKVERLWIKDANQDGRLSRAELGDTLWRRVMGQDANGDGVLDANEMEAMAGKAGRKSTGQARPGGANAAFQVREYHASNGQTLRYSLYVPSSKNATTLLPLVLCLHGAGGNAEAANILASSSIQSKHPCIIMAPACDGKSSRWVENDFRGGKEKGQRFVMPELIEALDAVVMEVKADPARLYITGHSMGGVGTWGLIANHSGKFAAAIPVAGHWSPADASKIFNVAILAFHGDEDKAVPVSGTRDMIDALKKTTIVPEPKYTEFPGVGHGSAGPTYTKPELWDWLFKQRKKMP